MSDSKPSKTLFLVVDSLGGRTAVTAERMWAEEDRVDFADDNKLVATFSKPSSVVATTAGAVSRSVELKPGMAVRAIRPRWGFLDWMLFGAVVANAVLMAYDQFVVGG